MLNTKVRTGIAVLGVALTITISTAAIAPSAYARKNNGCNQACQAAIGKKVVIDTPCDDLQNAYNSALQAIGDFSAIGAYDYSVKAAFDAGKLYTAAQGDGCGWAA